MPAQPSDPPLRHARLEGKRVAWVEVGEGPPIVMVHGLPGSHRDFRWLAPGLESHARVIRLDMPGCGGSEAIAPRLSVLAEHLLRRLDQLEVERALLVGHSIGCPQSLLAAARAPERVAGLALLASPGLRPHRGLRATRGTMPYVSRGLRTPLLRGPLMRVTSSAFVRAGFSRKTPPHEIQRAVDIVARIDFRAIRNAVAALRVPTFFAWAHDDALIEPAISEALAAALPEGPRLAFEQGGHNIQKTHADTLAAALVQWLPTLRWSVT